MRMKKSGIISRVTKWLLLSLAVICICMLPGNTVKAEGYNGLAVAEDGNWYLYTDGNINWGYNGLYNDPNCGWWYVNGGRITFTDTGVVANDYGWWYVRNSTIDWNYTGLAANEAGWWCIVNGGVDFNYNGLAYDPNVGWWYVENGAINFNYTGIYLDATCGWWYVNGGCITFTDTGLAANDYGWWYIHNSQIDFSYTGLKNNEAGWWYVQNGGINFGYTGVVEDPEAGFWYVENGGVNFGYNGMVTSNGKTYKVVNGYATVASGNARVENGVYQITLKSNSNTYLTVADSSVKDGAAIVAGTNALESAQYFEISLADQNRNLYRFKNVNSERYIDQGGSMSAGGSIKQNLYVDNLEDQLWYIDQNSDGTYSIKSMHSNLYLTVNGSKVTQESGGTQNSQKFVLQKKSTSSAVLATGIYSMTGSYCRLTALGDGLYKIYNTSKNGYVSASGSSVSYVSNGDSKAAKWYITKSGSNYAVKSANTNTYLMANGNLSSSTTAITINSAAGSVTNYDVCYDISAMKNSSVINTNAQVVKRLGALNLTMSSLMDPINKQAQLKKSINSAVSGLPTQTVDYNGTNNVDSLNAFLLANTGKIVRLQKNIEVYKDSSHSGIIYIPSNTILDGNGHELVLKSGGTVPDEAVVMYLWDSANQTVIPQKNCGVINLKTSLAYNNDVNLWGADNVVIKNNTFSNAKMCAVVASNDYVSTNVVVSGNKFNETSGDSVAVYGDHSSWLIENNTITNCKGRAAMMISAFKNGVHVKVATLTTGPHDIIVNGNTINNCTEGEGLYCIGTYRSYMTGNSISNCKLEGVCLDFGCIGVYFAQNEVYKTSLSGGLPGVSIDNGMYNILDGNKIHDNTCSGIKLVRTGYCNLIVNNTCYDNSSNKTDLTGRASSSAGIDIKCLDAYNDVDAEYIDDVGSSGNVLINNTIYGAHDSGIYIGENSKYGRSAGNMIESNSIKASYQYGVLDYSGQSNTVKNNIEY